MTISEKHDAIAAQYYKELDKANATIYHYSNDAAEKPNIAYIKNWLKKRNCNSFSDYLNYEQMF